MKDQFEIFIKETGYSNLKSFTDKEIVWKGIEQKLQRKKTRKLYVRLSIAATLLILITSGSLFFNRNQQPTAVSDYFAQISNELSETEFYFANLIEEKEKEIKKTGDFDKEFFQTYIDELKELDKQYESYKTEMKKYGYQEELIRAMIENQQEKLEILKGFLSEINKIKNYENRKKEYHI